MKRGIAIVLALGLAGIAIWWFACDHYVQKRASFSSARWKEGHAAGLQGFNPPARLEMIDSLLETHQLLGKTRPEIEDLLGPPESDTGGRVWYYVADSESLLQSTRRSLVIEYDVVDSFGRASGQAMLVAWE